MRRSFYSCLVILSLVFIGCKAVTQTPVNNSGGNTYYVSTTGSDTSGDGSLSNPWATPGYGSRQLHAGDTLIILGGTYVVTRYDDDIIKPSNSGTSGAVITIRGETGNRPKLIARNTADSGSESGLGMMVDLSGRSYITIENIEFTHDSTVTGSQVYVRDCITIADQPASNITLKDLYIHHIDQFGINIQDVNTLTVTNCIIEYTGFGSMGGPDAGTGGGWKNVVIDGCDLSYNGYYYQGQNSSADVYDRPDGIGLEESDGPIEIKNSLVEHNRGDGIDLKNKNAYVHENIVANNSCDGIKLWGSARVHNCLIYGTGDGTGGASPWANIVIGTSETNASFEIINCTIHDNPTREAYSMYAQYDERKAIKLVMRNNIISNSQGLIWIAPEVTDYTIENNLFYRYNSEEQIYAGGSNRTTSQLNSLTNCRNNISSDPQFTSPAWGSTGDYHLSSGSPAINAGTSTGAPSIDLAGSTRPASTQVDIGAYEQ